MKRKTTKFLWKRSLGVGLSLAMALTMLPVTPAKAAADDVVTYEDENEDDHVLNLVPGQKYFIANATEAVSADPSIAKVEEGSEYYRALYDYDTAVGYSLDTYHKDNPNFDIDMTEAEFLIEASEEDSEQYTIYNAAQNKYLTNQNARNYFEDTAIYQKLNKLKNDKDQTISFEIQRADSGRYCYFHYPKMGMDGLGGISDEDRVNRWEKEGDFGFEFLEKTDTPSNLDPILGYKRVSEITSGKTYLITEYYDDGIIVLYPTNGIEDQSKLYRAYELSGIYVTALKENTQTTVTVDGVVYDVVVGKECKHTGGRHIDGGIPSTCTTTGYTGDTYCDDCGQIIEKGEETPWLGGEHPSFTSKVTKEPTLEEDGEIVHSCDRCIYKYSEVLSSYEFAQDELKKAIASAEEKVAQTDVYTESTLNELKKVLDEAKKITEDAEKDAIVAAIADLADADSALVTKEFQEALDKLKGLVAQEWNAEEYVEGTFKTLQSAINNGRTVLDKGNYTVSTLKNASTKIENAIKNLVTIKDQEFADINAQLDEKFAEVEELLKNPTAYSAETFKALQDAYKNAQDTKNSEQIQADKDTEALRTVLANVQAAVDGLKAPEQQDQPKPPAPVENKVTAPTIKSVAASAGKNGISVKVTVNAVNGAAKCAVYRVVGGKAALVGNTANGVITDDKLTGSKASYYAVALDAAGKAISDNGAAKAITLESAIKIKKVTSSKSSIKITWNKAKKATGYIVYRSTKKNGSYSKIASVKKSKASYTDKKAAKGKTYYYKIVYKTKNGVSVMSAASKKGKRKK